MLHVFDSKMLSGKQLLHSVQDISLYIYIIYIYKFIHISYIYIYIYIHVTSQDCIFVWALQIVSTEQFKKHKSPSFVALIFPLRELPRGQLRFGAVPLNEPFCSVQLRGGGSAIWPSGAGVRTIIEKNSAWGNVRWGKRSI